MEQKFAPMAAGWSETFLMKDGQVAARLMHAGCEVHFEVLPEFRHRVIFRGVAQEFLRPLFEEFGFLTTKVPVLDDKNRRFVTRMGFQHTWSDADHDYFMLTALPFEKKGK